jgi:hypothetical protein
MAKIRIDLWHSFKKKANTKNDDTRSLSSVVLKFVTCWNGDTRNVRVTLMNGNLKIEITTPVLCVLSLRTRSEACHHLWLRRIMRRQEQQKRTLAATFPLLRFCLFLSSILSLKAHSTEQLML